jgi:hypothetical protein
MASIFLLITIRNNTSPHKFSPMMINVEECVVIEIFFFVFQRWHQKQSLGTTALGGRHCGRKNSEMFPLATES